jgi:hypothetical protein
LSGGRILNELPTHDLTRGVRPSLGPWSDDRQHRPNGCHDVGEAPTGRGPVRRDRSTMKRLWAVQGGEDGPGVAGPFSALRPAALFPHTVKVVVHGQAPDGDAGQGVLDEPARRPPGRLPLVAGRDDTPVRDMGCKWSVAEKERSHHLAAQIGLTKPKRFFN